MAKAKAGEHTDELWAEAGKLGYLGVNVPEEYGGGGGGITELAIVVRGAGRGRLPAAAARGLAGDRRHDHRQARHRGAAAALPARASPTARSRSCFAITEPEAGSNFHRLVTVARRDGDDWVITGRKCFISGVDEAAHVLVVARTEDAATASSSRRCSWCRPTRPG